MIKGIDYVTPFAHSFDDSEFRSCFGVYRLNRLFFHLGIEPPYRRLAY